METNGRGNNGWQNNNQPSGGKSTTTLEQTVQRPTGCSYFENTNLPLGHPARYILTSDADKQVQNAPQSQASRGRGYPKPHSNREQNAIPAVAPLREFPLLPGTALPWTPGKPPGPVRAIYNNNDRNQYGVVYHDPTKHGPLDFSLSQRRN